MQRKQMVTFHEAFICGNKFCFQHGNQSYFLPSFAGQFVLFFAIHHCLLWRQKINQKFSVIFKMAKVNFLLEVVLFFRTKGFQNTSCHLC